MISAINNVTLATSYANSAQPHENPLIEPIFDTTIKRRKTRPVKVGSVTIGGGNPVVVQSMINEDTLDIDGSIN